MYTEIYEARDADVALLLASYSFAEPFLQATVITLVRQVDAGPRPHLGVAVVEVLTTVGPPQTIQYCWGPPCPVKRTELSQWRTR